METQTGLHGEFPVWALLPRRETGVINFLAKNKTYDGRGTIIAIFDSGVDPAAPGLQVTTDGKVKVIDRLDASGAGDVDTSVVKKSVNGYITGLSGRKLQIPTDWVNPTGNYHIGKKNAFSLYPESLENRITRERKLKNWNPEYKQQLGKVQEEHRKCIQNAEQASKVNDNEKVNETKESSWKSFMEKLTKENAEAKVNLLTALEKKYEDQGPSYDCVVFHDGNVWRVCIDTSEVGDLQAGVFLGEYIKTHEHAFLTPEDQFTVSVNVYEMGNRLEVVGLCVSHGTHVASIAAANFPDDPDRNGVAPGAQIVSISIGDNRLGSMETMSAIIRAMTRVMQNEHYKVDLINMSYGEHAHTFKFGRFGHLAHEVVNKHGVIWLGSASNIGPALSTIGSPPDMKSDSIISVGAYVSPDMMTAEYAMVERLPACPYTWSSRGPTIDGARGVSICAPGGAITSVPCYTLRSSQLMNGTSMSAPHATGAFALLLSGLKQKKIWYSPYSVRRAVENTALYLDADPFAQGHGLLQIDKAFDHLCEYVKGVENKVRIVVECGDGDSKGFYLRNWEADKVVEGIIVVEPMMLNEFLADPTDKRAFDLEFSLSCDAPWVKFPPCLKMSYGARSFKVFIDPFGLTAGNVYTTSLKAYLSNLPAKGHIFEVPITVVIPYKNYIKNHIYSSPSILFRPGHIRRTFFKVPLEATWAHITIKSTNTKRPLRFTLQATQIRPMWSITTLDFSKLFHIYPDESREFTVCVKGGYTLELCLAKWWACAAEGEVEFTIEFHGLTPSLQMVSFEHSEQIQRVDLRVAFKNEDIAPIAVLKQLAQTYPPSDSKIEVLPGDRDTIPNSRKCYQLILSYSFTIAKSGLEVTPKFRLLNDVLYESPFGSQLYMLFDSNKYRLLTGDAYCEKYSVKLDKGDYTIRLHIRHERIELLEKLTEMPITIMIKLPQEVKLDIYLSHRSAAISGKKLQSKHLDKGEVLPLFISSPNLTDKSLKNIGLSVGHCLLGNISFAKDESVRDSDYYPLKVFITEFNLKKKSQNGGKGYNEWKNKSYNDYIESLKDLQSVWMGKLDRVSREKLYAESVEEFPECNAIRSAELQAICDEQNKDEDISLSRQMEVISLSREIIDSIDSNSMLAFYGTKLDTRQESSKHKTQMERKKNWLLDALCKNGLWLLNKIKDDTETSEEDINKIVLEILKFTDTNDSKVAEFFIQFYLHRNLEGLACRIVTKQCEEKYTKESEEKLIEVYKAMGWDFVVKKLKSSHPTRFPSTYTIF